MGGYRIALRAAVPWTRKTSIEGSRWALTGLDPVNGRVSVGVHVASDSAEIPYRFWPARNPRGLILLLHGCCDYSGAFDEIAPKFAKRGFTCMAYDQRGFGATASRGGWAGQDRMIEDANEMIAFLRGRTSNELPLFIVGESMGGSVAVHTAATHPDLNIDGLVLVAPGALASSLRNTFYAWLMRAIRWFAGASEIVVERTQARELSSAAAIRLLGDPLVMQAVKPDLLAGVFSMGYAAVDAAKHVQVPTLTLLAGKDDLLRAICVRQLHDNLAGPKVWRAIKDAPHLLLHWQRGGLVLRYMRRWIDRQMRARP